MLQVLLGNEVGVYETWKRKQQQNNKEPKSVLRAERALLIEKSLVQPGAQAHGGIPMSPLPSSLGTGRESLQPGYNPLHLSEAPTPLPWENTN